jgi:hypothetical protein
VNKGCIWLVAGIWLLVTPLARATIVSIWPFEMIAQAPVIATCVVEATSRDALPAGSQARMELAHATLRVLRSFPASVLSAGKQIRLDYDVDIEQARGASGHMLEFKPGEVFALPLKLNPHPQSAPWRLIADQGLSLVIPAIASTPPFSAPPEDGRSFLLDEIASAFLLGTRQDLFAEANYTFRQEGISAALMTRLESQLAAASDRWTVIAAAFLSSFPIPRPTVADLRAGKGAGYSESLVIPVLQKLGPSEAAKEKLLHQLLLNSDFASWGVGMTIPEFSQEPSLVRELQLMLKARRPGSLSVARSLLVAGQKDVLANAIELSFYYLATQGTEASEFQQACWIIRDYGTDVQFGRVLAEIRASQFRDQPRYDELWRNLIWSDNPRERAVLDIMLPDHRMSGTFRPYSDIARDELVRLQALKR